jgi:hypothetical protein
MNQEYLIGELSVRLEQLQAAARHAAASDLADLRHQVENRPVTWLAAEMIRALALGDLLCWDSLAEGDTSAFDRQAAICSDLRLFGVCARLIDDG